METKIDKPKMDLHPIIRDRFSSRLMDPDRPVPAEVLDLLLEAARWAPSSGNGQPWRYLIFDSRHPRALQKARQLLNDDNRVWAGKASVLILAVAKEVRTGGKINRYAQHDLGLANQNLLLQAAWMGLHARPMAGFDRAGAEKAFHIPEGYRAMVMIAIGYPGRLEEVHPEVQAKEKLPRRRKPQEQFVFLGDWSD
ncbi:MAG: nitroreductase family protein [Anaerolineales bacterium]|jgi:nitroreductase